MYVCIYIFYLYYFYLFRNVLANLLQFWYFVVIIMIFNLKTNTQTLYFFFTENMWFILSYYSCILFQNIQRSTRIVGELSL